VFLVPQWGGYTVGNSELQRPSKRIRIVLSILAVTIASAIAPMASFAADWTGQ
jgi:hypothetical protein